MTKKRIKKHFFQSNCDHLMAAAEHKNDSRMKEEALKNTSLMFFTIKRSKSALDVSDKCFVLNLSDTNVTEL